jgi:uncharacterized protein (TIGR02300 family)
MRDSACFLFVGQWTMTRPHLGTKCTCATCKERFYDLGRSPAVCPKCGAEQPPEVPVVRRPLRNAAPARPLPPKPDPVIAEQEEAEVIDSDEDEPDDVADLDDDAEIEINPDREKLPD